MADFDDDLFNVFDEEVKPSDIKVEYQNQEIANGSDLLSSR